MKPKKDEFQIKGNWFLVDGTMQKDSECQRIEFLVENYLNKISVSDDGWDVLYRDPSDNRLWELIYPQSEMFGGGPPCLTVISPEDAQKKYQK